MNRAGINININIIIDYKFWAITPAINLNFHNGFVFEVEWLCLGIYISK